MRVLLGAALVAGAYADGHRVCAAPECTTCAADFKKCGGEDIEANAGFKAADADKANCENTLQAIFNAGETLGKASKEDCEGFQGVFTPANAEPAAAWSVATCKQGDADVGDASSEVACQVPPTFTPAVAAADLIPAVAASATEGECTAAGANWDAGAGTCDNGEAEVPAVEAKDAECTLGGPTTNETDCEAAVPVFTAASCNDVGNTGPADKAACELLKGPATLASCTIGGALRDKTNDGSTATFTGECDAGKAGLCVNSCKDAPKAAGSSADDGSAASPAAMIATGMAFLALFL